jgi:hypothetical protein
VDVTAVSDETTSACIYANQDAANAAFTNWLAGFSVSGGCTPTFSTTPENPAAPAYCGGSIEVVWTVTDHCYNTSTHTATFTITEPATVDVTAVSDETTSACIYANQEAANTAFTNWLAGFSVSGGCTPTFSTTLENPVAPAYCGGSTQVVWTVTDHCYNTSTHTATFTITEPAAVDVTAVSDETTSACIYANQDAANTAFTNWLAGFSVSGGCTPTFSTTPENPVAPAYCGGSTQVVWTVTDHCYNTSTHTATFTITEPATVDVTAVSDETTSACIYANQDAANTAFTNWLAGFSVSGGCTPTFSTTPENPVAPAYCGGSTQVVWTVTDHCYNTSTHTATFTITEPAAVDVTAVSDETTSACIYANQDAANTAFTNWLAGFSVGGGCTPTFSTTPVNPVAPAYCGGSTQVVWTVTDHCYNTSTHTATFTITEPAAVDVTAVSDETTSACIYANQDAANTAFTNWLAGFSVGGGCTPTFSTTPENPAAPAYCGGSTQVVWTVTDHCYNTSTHTATFTITEPAAVDVTAVSDETTSACIYANQDAANTAFTNWLAGFSVSGGCTPTFSTTPEKPAAPAYCGGSTQVVWTVTDHCYNTSTHTATFTITEPAAVDVTAVSDETTSACIYANQEAANTAFTNWLAGFSVSGGCTPTFSTTLENPVAPEYCGGSTQVVWTVTDHCYNTSTHTATFTITEPAAVDVTAVSDETTSACIYANQDAANTAFTNWLAGFSVSGGCTPTFSTTLENPVAPAYCGGSTQVVWTVTDHCYNTSTHTATFTITEPAAVDVTAVSDETTSACIYANQDVANTAFTNWLAGFSVSGGCTPTFSTTPENPVAPAYCGGSIEVVWTVTDHCYNTSTHTATFTITTPNTLIYNNPSNSITQACNLENQAALNVVFDQWLKTQTDEIKHNFSGGCNPTTGHDFADNYPDFFSETPVIITVTWTIDDLCEDPKQVSATFTFTPGIVLTVSNIGSGSGEAKYYCTIQAAIDAAGEGDVILISAGTYDEDVDTKNKNLTLRFVSEINPPSKRAGSAREVVIDRNLTLSKGDKLEMEIFGKTDFDKLTVSGNIVFRRGSSLVWSIVAGSGLQL